MAKEKGGKPRYLTKALRCPDGTRKYIRGKTQEELDRKVRQAQVELGLGLNINDDTTVAEFAQMWLDVYKRPHVQPQTVDMILSSMNTHVIPVIGGMRLKDVRPADCALIFARMNGKAKQTQNQVRIRLREMFECARENKRISENPVTKNVRSSGRPPVKRVPLTREQLEELCRVAQLRGKDDLYTFVLLCGYAGLREAEALGLSLDNVDLKEGIIYVREQYYSRKGKAGTTPVLKTSMSAREVPMPPVLLAHLSKLKRERGGGYIFNTKSVSLRTGIQNTMSRLCAVDCRGEPRSANPRCALLPFYVHPHLLRHTYATLCFEAGMDIKEVQYLLGHSTTEMTLDVYTHYVKSHRREGTTKKLAEAFPAPKITALG